MYFSISSMPLCENLVDGRLSFGGMNSEIEKYMTKGYNKLLREEDSQSEKDISDVEMVEGYTSLVDTVGKKIQSKRWKMFSRFFCLFYNNNLT